MDVVSRSFGWEVFLWFIVVRIEEVVGRVECVDSWLLDFVCFVLKEVIVVLVVVLFFEVVVVIIIVLSKVGFVIFILVVFFVVVVVVFLGFIMVVIIVLVMVVILGIVIKDGKRDVLLEGVVLNGLV